MQSMIRQRSTGADTLWKYFAKGNDLRDGDTGNLHAHTEDGITERRIRHLRLEAEDFTRRTDVSRHGSVFDGAPDEHQDARHHTGKADTHLVEDHPSEDQHQEEDVEPPVGGGKEAEIGTGPSQFGFEHRFQRRHDVCQEIAAQHREGDNSQRCPAGRLRIT